MYTIQQLLDEETWISHKFSVPFFSTSALILIFICFWYIMWKMKNVVENSFSHKIIYSNTNERNEEKPFHGGITDIISEICNVAGIRWFFFFPGIIIWLGFVYCVRESWSWVAQMKILHYSLNTSLNSYLWLRWMCDVWMLLIFVCMNLGSMCFVLWLKGKVSEWSTFAVLHHIHI